ATSRGSAVTQREPPRRALARVRKSATAFADRWIQAETGHVGGGRWRCAHRPTCTPPAGSRRRSIGPRRGACPRSPSRRPPSGLVRPVDLLEDLLPRRHASLSRSRLIEQHAHAPLAELTETGPEGRVARQRGVHIGDNDDRTIEAEKLAE